MAFSHAGKNRLLSYLCHVFVGVDDLGLCTSYLNLPVRRRSNLARLLVIGSRAPRLYGKHTVESFSKSRRRNRTALTSDVNSATFTALVFLPMKTALLTTRPASGNI